MVLARLARLCWRELRSLAADWRLLAIIIATPIAYTVLFGYLYQPKRVVQIATWVIDEDHSALSRAITSATANSETFKVVRVGGSLEEFRQATLRGAAYACIYIPRDFERDAKLGKSVRLLTLIDGGNMIIANSVLRGGAEIAGTYSVGVQMKRLSMRGTPSMYAQPAAMPVESATRVWYNPAFNYMDFLLPGLLGTVIQQVALLGVALAFAREREKKQLGAVLRISRSPLELLTAKAIVYTTLNLIMAGIAYWIIVAGFGVQIVGSIKLFALLLTIFITALVAMGIVISAIARDQLFATQILMLIAVPSFLLSGFTWPQMSMQKGILAISNLLPLTHFVLPLRQIFMQGADLSVIRPHLLWLWSLTAISYLLAYPIIRRALRQAECEETETRSTVGSRTLLRGAESGTMG